MESWTTATTEFKVIVRSSEEFDFGSRRVTDYIVPFCLGLSSFLEIELAGRLSGADIVLLAGFASTLLIKASHSHWREIWILLGLALLWFFGAVITDLVRQSAWIDLSRGWSKILILFAGLYFLGLRARRDPSWIVAFWLGLVVGLGIKPFVIVQYGFAVDPWKFGLALATIGLLFVISETPQFVRRFGLTGFLVACTGLALVSLWQNYRSMFALLAMTALAVGFRVGIHSLLRNGRLNPFGLIVLSLVILSAFEGISAGYATLAESGVLGYVAQTKYQDQQMLGLNALQSGRQESLVSIQAIEDSPIIGHGSWARDRRYVDMLVGILKSRGLAVPPSSVEDDLIPTHSYLIGGWIENGILSVPFWLYFIFLCIRGLWRGIMPDCPRRGLLIFLCLLNLWDVLFSPFGTQARLLVATAAVIIVAQSRQRSVQRRVRRGREGRALPA